MLCSRTMKILSNRQLPCQATTAHVTTPTHSESRCISAHEYCGGGQCSNSGMSSQVSWSPQLNRLPALLVSTALACSMSLLVTVEQAAAGTPFSDAAELTSGLQQGCVAHNALSPERCDLNVVCMNLLLQHL